MARAIIVMGVAGSGKSTVGRRLGEVLGWPFYDGDGYMTPENVAKMAAGTPLDDADRTPWLEALHDLVAAELARGVSLVLACSALKAAYRRALSEGHAQRVRFVYLKGNFELIQARMAARADHYMKPAMLYSQFDDLEEPEEALVIDIDQDVKVIVSQVEEGLGLATGREKGSR